MNYPNLAAEIEAQAETDGFGFQALARAANVTPELLREIVWGSEDINLGEALPLYRSLSPLQDYGHYSMGYLYSPVLAVVKPGTNKTKYRLHLLRQLLTEAERLTPPHWWLDKRQRAQLVLARMERGEAVTYAEYRTSINLARHIIIDRRQAAAQPRPRGIARNKAEVLAHG